MRDIENQSIFCNIFMNLLPNNKNFYVFARILYLCKNSNKMFWNKKMESNMNGELSVHKGFGQKDVGLCLRCKNIGKDGESCTKDYLFLIAKSACIAFESAE